MNQTTDTGLERDPAHGFADRLIMFQDSFGFSNPEAADMIGISYSAYTRWKTSNDKLPSKPIEIQKLVSGAYAYSGQEQKLPLIKRTVAWLCFGIEDLNPFKEKTSFDKESVAEYCLEHLRIYDQLVADAGVDRDSISEKKRYLAIKKILSCTKSSDLEGYCMDDEDAVFVRELLSI